MYYQDKITIDRIIKGAHPLVRDKMLNAYIAISWELRGKAVIRFSHVLRTWQEQDVLYAQGRTTSGKKVTNARGGFSWHNYGFAFDIVLLVDTDFNGSYETASWNDKIDYDKDGKSDWSEVVEICKELGFAWGGDFINFKDKPHFQFVPEGLTIEIARRLYLGGSFIPGTKFIKI